MIETDGLVGRRARDTVYSVCIVKWWCILPSALSKHTHTHDSMPESSTELWSQLRTKLKLSYERGGEEKKTWLSILATAKRVNIFPHWKKKSWTIFLFILQFRSHRTHTLHSLIFSHLFDVSVEGNSEKEKIKKTLLSRRKKNCHSICSCLVSHGYIKWSNVFEVF